MAALKIKFFASFKNAKNLIFNRFPSALHFGQIIHKEKWSSQFPLKLLMRDQNLLLLYLQVTFLLLLLLQLWLWIHSSKSSTVLSQCKRLNTIMYCHNYVANVASEVWRWRMGQASIRHFIDLITNIIFALLIHNVFLSLFFLPSLFYLNLIYCFIFQADMYYKSILSL